MAIFVHKQLFVIRRPSRAADLPGGVDAWWRNPDLAGLCEGTGADFRVIVPERYWKAGPAGPVEMTAEEKAAVDADLLPRFRVARVAALKDEADAFVSRFLPAVSRDLAIQLKLEAVAKGYAQRLAYLAPLDQFQGQVLAAFAVATAAVESAASEAAVDAVALDISAIVYPAVDLTQAAGINA